MNRASVLPHLERRVGRVLVEARRGSAGSELPVIVLDRGVTGPTAVVTANLHGDETTGIGVAHRLDRWLQQHAFTGRVVLYPSANPQGLRAQTRHVPADELDLNRVFPGNARGSWTARIAAALWRDLAGHRPDLVVDLHADAPVSLPYVILDRPVRLRAAARRDLSARLLALGEATGLTVLREYDDEVYVQFGLDRSLAGAVVNQLGVPAITIEAGPRRQLDDAAVEAAFSATLGALTAAGVVEAPAPAHPSRVEGAWRRAATPRSRKGGLVQPIVLPGETFGRRDRLARIVDLVGEPVEEVRADESGLLVSWVEGAFVSPGGLLGTVGVPDEGGL